MAATRTTLAGRTEKTGRNAPTAAAVAKRRRRTPGGPGWFGRSEAAVPNPRPAAVHRRVEPMRSGHGAEWEGSSRRFDAMARTLPLAARSSCCSTQFLEGGADCCFDPGPGGPWRRSYLLMVGVALAVHKSGAGRRGLRPAERFFVPERSQPPDCPGSSAHGRRG